jgi:hypothetical protein
MGRPLKYDLLPRKQQHIVDVPEDDDAVTGPNIRSTERRPQDEYHVRTVREVEQESIYGRP